MNGKMALYIAVMALLVAGAACVFSIFAVLRADPSEIENRVYQRILQECWQEMQPMLRDFEVNVPEHPETFRDLFEPFMSIQPDLTEP